METISSVKYAISSIVVFLSRIVSRIGSLPVLGSAPIEYGFLSSFSYFNFTTRLIGVYTVLIFLLRRR